MGFAHKWLATFEPLGDFWVGVLTSPDHSLIPGDCLVLVWCVAEARVSVWAVQ